MPPLVVVAVKVAEVLGQMVVPGLTLILMVGVTELVTAIVILLLVAVLVDAQLRLLVMVQLITSPLARLLLVYVVPVAILLLFFFHW